MRAVVKSKPRPLWDLSKEVAPGFIRLTRQGKPVAYILLASHYDEEDIGYMTDPGFWEMIRERREDKTGIPWEQVKAEVVQRNGAATSRRSGTKANGTRKGKRNAPTRS